MSSIGWSVGLKKISVYVCMGSVLTRKLQGFLIDLAIPSGLTYHNAINVENIFCEVKLCYN